MKKLLISILIILICILTIITVLKGINIGNLNILGITQIREENSNLETKLAQATSLVSTDYPNEIKTLNADVKSMKSEKESYEDMVAVSTESEVAAAMQSQKYTVDKLWAKLGTLATDEGLDAKFELTNGSLKSSDQSQYQYYNIGFTVQGSYASISLYISDLEDDSELGFKIENFKMEPVDGGDTVKATFLTKDIAIMGVSTATVTTNQDNTKTENTNTTNQAANNTTGTQNTTNTRNSTTNTTTKNTNGV